MNTVITVSNIKGTLHCSNCGKPIAYDLTGHPPSVTGNARCPCGVVLLVKRDVLRASLGPSEVKGATLEGRNAIRHHIR